jgi:hypothetical protein
MAKYVLEDMVKTKRARKPVRRVEEVPPVKNIEPEEFIEREEFIPEKKISRQSKGGSRHALWAVAFISALFFGFAISFLFSSGKVSVNPKMEDVALNENFSASSVPQNGSLFFDMVVISGEEKNTIGATEEKDVAERATGTAVIFNSFSAAPQKLAIDTRLIGSNGKIYKTKVATTVPGMSGGTAGSVEVGIYAAEAGEAYNSGPLDFNILGFKGTPKYDKFKVRTKTGTEIKGGFVGKAPVVSEEEKTSAVTTLKTDLEARLLQKATDQIPSGFILFKDAVFLNSDEADIASVYNPDKTMTLTLKGTLYGILFNEQKLTKKLAESSVPKYDGSEVYVPNIRDLKFSLSGAGDVPFADLKNINFNLSGSAKFVWKVDEGGLTQVLLGQPKKDFADILSKYENIESASLKINPPWRSSIPEKTEEVKIIVNYPKQS